MTRRILAALCAAGLAGLPLAAAATAYTLTIEDDAIRHPGEVVSFVTRINDANGLAGFDLDIAFDPAVLALTGVRSEVFLDSDSNKSACEDFPPADCFTGQDRGNFVSILASSFQGLSGTATPLALFTLDFTVRPTAAPGQTTLSYQAIELVDANLVEVPGQDLSASGATLTVTPAVAPAAPPWLLVVPGLAALAARRRRLTRARGALPRGWRAGA